MRRSGVRRGNARFPALLLRIKPSSASSGNMPKSEFNRVVVLLETSKSISRNNSTRLSKGIFLGLPVTFLNSEQWTMNVKLKRIEVLLKNYRQIIMHIFYTLSHVCVWQMCTCMYLTISSCTNGTVFELWPVKASTHSYSFILGSDFLKQKNINSDNWINPYFITPPESSEPP